MRSAAVLLALGLGSLACDGSPETVPSTAVRTAELQTNVTASSNGAAVLLDVTLFASPTRRPPVVPSEGEPFLASAADASRRPLAPYDGRWYLLLPTVSSQVLLELARAEGPTKETLDLPPPFVIDAPTAAPSRAMPIAITWAPPAPQAGAAITVRGACIGTVRRQVASDIGAFTFYPGDFAVAAGTGPCTFEIEVRRAKTMTTTGPLGGARTLAQVRTLEVPTVP